MVHVNINETHTRVFGWWEVDCSVVRLQVPSPPGDEDEDFILVHHSDVQLSEKAEEVYTHLAKILKEQYEVGQQGEAQSTEDIDWYCQHSQLKLCFSLWQCFQMNLCFFQSFI